MRSSLFLKIQIIVLVILLSLFPIGCGAGGLPASLPADPANGSERTAEDWHLTNEWSYIGQCSARAMIVYFLIANKFDGQTMEDQLRALQARDDLGDDKQRYIDSTTEMLREVYDRSGDELLQFPPAIAADCISSSSYLNIDLLLALDCFDEYQRPMYEAILDKRRKASKWISTKEADEGFYVCLLGSLKNAKTSQDGPWPTIAMNRIALASKPRTVCENTVRVRFPKKMNSNPLSKQ
ncbi:MAG TPA: hypothetical protein VF471_12810 [Pseudoxanthomonas sp.]